ncbi:kinesin-like protein KIF19 [Trichonephila inaurata madagascariensis]|uniref:Kinesin-like protein n=2 Tax=Trichonephila TaxID=2585208 RepID=A0A8X6MFR1_9ARAC|nr:kinesin-like protein KIF19 [Trichonephila inaurata madagascariensis]
MVLLQDPTAGDPVDILRAKRAQEKKYIFDWAFDEHSSQEEVYEKTTKNLVENVVEGYNGTVFAYGATGSGKTHTMVGIDDDPGIMVRALKDLFKEVDMKNKMYDVSMSYLEIYNENIRDLLNPSTAQLELREDAKGNHQVAGLSEVEIFSSEEVMSLLMRGNKRRTQESTGANKTSSRSHAVLMVQVKKRSPAHSHEQTMRTGRLYMVDLAGSERAAQTQNTGKRLLEGAHINKSLLALGNCINALDEKKLTDEEMKQIKKQLISSFNSQMDVRRRMMEIDNHLLAQSIEFDKLGMIIGEWETEKAVSALENGKEDQSNEIDANKNDPKNDMPEHVFHAWEELQFLKGQHERYLEMRQDCENDYQNCKDKTHSVTESLSVKASSREQRELLHLLTRVYELEIETLATGEKSKNANARKELNELYRIYQQEIQELNSGRHSDLGQLSLYDSLYRPTSSGLRPLGSSGSMLELHQLESSKSPDSRTSRAPNPLPPIGSQGENNDGDKRLFLRRKRQPYRRGSDDDSIGTPHLPPISNNPLDPRNRRANSRFSNSSSNSSTSVTDRRFYRSLSINSPLDFTAYSNASSHGGSSDSSDYREKLKKVDEFEEPLKKRFGILPSLRVRKGRGTSSDSEVLIYNKNERCPDDFFRASNTTCLHIALPTSMGPKEWYCNTKGGELFGRPLTEDLQEALSNEMKAQAEKWMPPRTYTGLERRNNGYDMGKKSELWKFHEEDEIFHQSDYKVWNKEPTKGDDCAVVGLETEFKVEEENCLIAHGLLCNKNEFPCETPNLFYSNYGGFCLSVVDDHKTYPNAIGSCAEGHLLKMRNLSYVEPTIQAFYNSKFYGGIYIGLELNDNGAWIYNNG